MFSDNQTFSDQKIKRRKGRGDDNKIIRRNTVVWSGDLVWDKTPHK